MAGVIDTIRRHGVLGVLIAVNVAVFAAAALSLTVARLGSGASIEPWLALSSNATVLAARPWTLLTYMFTHVHPLHLLFNMLWLAWFGSMLLERLSTRTFVWIYLGGGVSGALLYLLMGPILTSTGSYLMGASAAVLALMTTAAILMPSHELHLFFIGDVKLKWVALFMILLAFLGLGGGNSGGELSHLGGAAYGIVAGLVIRSPRRKAVKIQHTKKPKHVSRVISIMEQHRLDNERLDELLDKIRISGFDSLSSAERRELEMLSKRVTK